MTCPRCDGFFLEDAMDPRCINCGYRPPEPEPPKPKQKQKTAEHRAKIAAGMRLAYAERKRGRR